MGVYSIKALCIKVQCLGSGKGSWSKMGLNA